MKQILTLAFSVLFTALPFFSSLFAQHEPLNPYETIGKKAEVLTLSKGKYQETFSNDTIMRIGSVMYHRFTGEVVIVVEDDTLYGEYSLQPEAMSRWLSIDPLVAKYPNWSPYAYTFNNPVIYTDPDGKEGILSVNAQNRTVTVKAVYYVEAGANGFSREAYQQFQGINATLNNQGQMVNDANSPYNGFGVVYDLQFVPVGTEAQAQGFATQEADLMNNNMNAGRGLIVDGNNIANSIIRMDDAAFNALPDVVQVAAANGVDVNRVGGMTSDDGQHISLPERRQNNELTKIHEIFHTLYFDRDGANDGIGSGRELPNQNEVNTLINGFINNNRVVNEN